MWILTSFFAEMPWEFEQAARVDGCTPGQAFRMVIRPLAAPGLFTTIMAAGTIVTVPLVILVLLFQRRIISGLTAGAIK